MYTGQFEAPTPSGAETQKTKKTKTSSYLLTCIRANDISGAIVLQTLPQIRSYDEDITFPNT